MHLWANAGFQKLGVCLQEVPSCPSPTPSFLFLSLAPLFTRAKRQNPVPLSLFAPQAHGNACYAGYVRTRQRDSHTAGHSLFSHLFNITHVTEGKNIAHATGREKEVTGRPKKLHQVTKFTW